MLLFFFFFSSRRRHTRYIGDWSSDVCSSDLQMRLLERIHSTPRDRTRKLKRLEKWLGDDHNLALLRTTLLHTHDRDIAQAKATMLGCIVERQTVLRGRALEAS